MKMLPGINNKHSREDKYTKTVLQTLMLIKKIDASIQWLLQTHK